MLELDVVYEKDFEELLELERAMLAKIFQIVIKAEEDFDLDLADTIRLHHELVMKLVAHMLEMHLHAVNATINSMGAEKNGE